MLHVSPSTMYGDRCMVVNRDCRHFEVLRALKGLGLIRGLEAIYEDFDCLRLANPRTCRR
jgi:hypothetical protein